MAAELPAWLEESASGTRIFARVTPRASRNEIVGVRADQLLVRVTAAPEGGHANGRACKLIAKRLHIGATNVSVIAGASSRNKTFEVAGMGAGEVLGALAS